MRGFFFALPLNFMHRGLLFILLIGSLGFCHKELRAQQNHYASVIWLQDVLLPDSLEFREASLTNARTLLKGGDSLRNFIDSNALSRIVYSNGSNANQRFLATLERPISESVLFHFELDRHSYMGWMDRSFYRSTRVNSGLIIRPNDRVLVDIEAGYINEDRELNGGLVQSTYSADETIGGAFESIYTDIHLANAFNRNSLLHISAAGDYKLINASGFRLSAIAGGVLDRERFEYEDSDGGTQNYYDRYLGTVQAAINDSSGVTTFREFAGLHLEGGDSLLGFELGGRATQMQHRIVNAGRSFNAWNTLAIGWAGLHYKSAFASLQAEQYLGGFNDGDQAQTLTVGLRHAVNSDSSGRRGWQTSLRLKRMRAFPRLQCFNYLSDVGDIRNIRTRSNENLLEAKLGFDLNGVSFFVMPGIRSIDDYQYWDSTATLHVADEAINQTYLHLSAGWKKRHFEVFLDQWLQESSNDSIYSLPELTTQAGASTMWPLFKKRLSVKLGLNAQYFSSYFARGYIGHLDVYYAQSERQFGEYLQLDFNASVDIKNTQIFFRLMNLNYQLFMSPVLVGPNFPSVPRYFILGIDWKFKN